MTHDPITKTTYVQVYLALLALLGATVGVYFVNLGPFNLFVALAVAVTKALLVALFFMHVRYNPKIIWIYACLGILWFLHLIGGTLADVLTRR